MDGVCGLRAAGRRNYWISKGLEDYSYEYLTEGRRTRSELVRLCSEEIPIIELQITNDELGINKENINSKLLKRLEIHCFIR